MKEESFTLQRHYRLYSDKLVSYKNKHGISSNGGITVASLVYKDEDQRKFGGFTVIRLGVAVCHIKDNFNKEEGRKKAFGRARSKKSQILLFNDLTLKRLEKIMINLALQYFEITNKIDSSKFYLFTGVKEYEQLTMEL